MNEKPSVADIHDEVLGLHEFFVAWFSGSCEESDAIFRSEFLDRIDADFVLIPPAGEILTLSSLAQAIRPRHGSNPNFRIAIRNVTVRRAFPGHVLATYEEWQRNAIASKPPDNGRIATALFRAGEQQRWVHVHETWLPNDIMAAGPYNF